MISWKRYKGHEYQVIGKRKLIDTTIYTFDIETTSYLVLNGEVIPASDYEELSSKERESAIKCSNMYIWMFGINDKVYYGRTWDEFISFITKLNENTPELKVIFIHNLAFEFQYLKSIFHFDEVAARISHKPMKALCKDFNFEMRCTYMMSNCSLAKLPKLFNLPVEKKVGDLDYKLLRHSKTRLTKKELGYCEYDCLVVYEYIKYELKTYSDVYHIPITSTGHVRNELKELTRANYSYKNKVRKAVNTNGHIYNLLVAAFSGGYTHANYVYTDEIVENVNSWDFTSSYPYVMVTYKYPMSKFRIVNVTSVKDLRDNFAYLLRVRFNNIISKYNNNFISKSKCLSCDKAVMDNGRIISADYVEMVLTDVDFKLILDTYNMDSYEILESYSAVYRYLPHEFINFILDKYVKKTKYKNDPEHELEYAKEKSLFNSLYGMTVTNTIRPEVDLIDEEWVETPLTNSDILEKLEKEEKDGFLSFSWGVWVTAYARNNLIRNIIQLDKYQVYADTDSLKLADGYNEEVIKNYNKSVEERIKRVSEELRIPLEKFAPTDIKGKVRMLGVFDHDGYYKEFITQGAKKYAYKTEDDEIHITVSGVPKSGAVCLKGDLRNFKDDLLFAHKYTNKNTVMYCEEQSSIEYSDYLGVKSQVSDKSGCCILPTSYVLSKSLDYAELLSSRSTERQLYKE
jgi:hypothetical protein